MVPTTENPGAHENRLAHETSPYLLQHKNNPVDWWPWGPQALAQAKAQNKPILLSVGYAACHWCHVMAHESFEDEATAKLMNQLFVNIKVDREERPDIDQIYMQALHHLGEQGGWPLTMFLTPGGEPFWGGTYFPKQSRYGRPAFTDVLREVARIFHEEPEKIVQNKDALMSRLAAVARGGSKVALSADDLDRFAEQLGGAMDPLHGGLRGAPKFPQCSLLEYFWRTGQRSHEPRYFDIVELTLARISEGGIYDHLGGGFSRYAVDDKWLVPHFEKMLYDNAQLLELLALAYRKTGKPLFLQRIRETIGWLEREMTVPGGAFCASLDADSEGEEGKFYVWSLAEIAGILSAENAAFFAAEYDLSAEGNFEGKNILNRLNNLPRSMETESKLAMLRVLLHKERDKRVRPGLDDKILADWNGLMIASLAETGAMLDEPGWIALGERAFDFIAREMTESDRLGHSWREGRLLFPGLASDFASMIRAALALFEATGARRFLDRALSWQAAFDRHYANPDNGGYFLTANDAEGLILRPAGTTDDAIPNPNALAAQNLIRLAAFTGDSSFRDKADRLIEGVLALGHDNLFGHIGLLNALDMRLDAAEIVVTGEGEAAERLIRAALAQPFLNRILLRAPSVDALPSTHPACAMIAAASGRPAAFLCRGETCSPPVTDPQALSVQALRAFEK